MGTIVPQHQSLGAGKVVRLRGLLAGGHNAARELPPPPIHCLAYLVQAFSCLPYLTDASPAPPTTSCCYSFIVLLNSAGRMWLCNVIMADPHLFTCMVQSIRFACTPFRSHATSDSLSNYFHVRLLFFLFLSCEGNYL
jgi:hypothetical protein